MTLSLRKTRQQLSRSPYRAHATPPHIDQHKSQGSSKLGDLPLNINIFPYKKPQVLTDKVFTIFMKLCNLKHGYHHCTDLGQLKILSNSLPSPQMLKILKPIPFPLQRYPTWSLHHPCTYTTYIHHNDIININIISFQCHHQHQHHLISMSSSTSSHLNIIINISIISYQYYNQNQHYLISILSSTSTSSHINIIINITRNRIPHIYV